MRELRVPGKIELGPTFYSVCPRFICQENTQLAKAFSLSVLVMLWTEWTPFYSVLSLIYLPRDSIFEKRGLDWKNITKCQAFHEM
jgi:hypothetical protein